MAGIPPASFSLRDLKEEENLQAIGLGFVSLGIVVIGGSFGPVLLETAGYTVHHWVHSNFDATLACVAIALPFIWLGVRVSKRGATACFIALVLYGLAVLSGLIGTLAVVIEMLWGQRSQALHEAASIFVFIVAVLGYTALSRSTIVCTDAYSLVIADTPNEKPAVSRSPLLWLMLVTVVVTAILPR